MNKPVPTSGPDVPNQPVEPDTPFEVPPEDGKTPLKLPHENDQDTDMTDDVPDPKILQALPRSEQVAEFMLYVLWDLRLKVGHSARSIDDCIRLARGDQRSSLAFSSWPLRLLRKNESKLS